MANYYSMARTNYFVVKDPDLFREEVNTIVNMGEEIEIWDSDANPKKFGLGFPNGLPAFVYNEETHEEIEIDWQKIIGRHLEDDWVCVIQEVGWENLRYMTGTAIAFNNKEESEGLTLDEIYAAGENLGKHCTQAMY